MAVMAVMVTSSLLVVVSRGRGRLLARMPRPRYRGCSMDLSCCSAKAAPERGRCHPPPRRRPGRPAHEGQVSDRRYLCEGCTGALHPTADDGAVAALQAG